MSSNEEKILLQYGLGEEERRASLTRSSSLEFYYTKKHLEGLIGKDGSILELGCATGHYGFYFADKCREYLGIDIVPSHIRLFQQKIDASGLKNISCRIGDATQLKRIEANHFDAVLCLGPHVSFASQRERTGFRGMREGMQAGWNHRLRLYQ